MFSDHSGREVGIYDKDDGWKSLNLFDNGLIGRADVIYDTTQVETEEGWVDFIQRFDERFYYIKDSHRDRHLGSIQVTIDQTNQVTASQDYSAYGEIWRSLNSSTPGDRYKFTEKELDIETGYAYHGARYYDPWRGSWNSADPLEDKYPGLWSYNYCAGNPLNNIDPDGRKLEKDEKLFAPIVDKKGNQKEYDDMTDEERGRFLFQSWWNAHGEKVEKLFGKGGKYESVTLRLKAGHPNQKSTDKHTNGFTLWGTNKNKPEDMHRGGRAVNTAGKYDLKNLAINVYINVNSKKINGETIPHEFEHVSIIIHFVEIGGIVPKAGYAYSRDANDQHGMMKLKDKRPYKNILE